MTGNGKGDKMVVRDVMQPNFCKLYPSCYYFLEWRQDIDRDIVLFTAPVATFNIYLFACQIIFSIFIPVLLDTAPESIIMCE